MKNKIRLTESQLHNVIKESVKKILKELQGNSSANGYRFDLDNGEVEANGGPFPANSLDTLRDQEKYEKEQEAKRRYNSASPDVREWFNRNYYNIMGDGFKGVRNMTPEEAYERFHSMYA